MAKQLNVNLAFNADTSKVKAELASLQSQLTSLVNTPTQQLPVTGSIHEAIRATAELKTHLTAATNVRTGNLDFTKLNQSINASGKSLEQYAAHLRSLGPQGQQAFMQLAQSVAQAEIPIRRSNSALMGMWTTLKNTARWQISSSILHGFMGAISSAYGYAKDLNESLNNIRIVTGQSTDQMAKFAKQANKAAKELSTTTTAYTDASLIFYQQGLKGSEVTDRADVVIKMANVTRQGAAMVSDQMTAVWNNFYDGSKSLEYYADVMTALGAATASSTDEIATGLEKFASVAETVGLSYEYATAALATVTATTRQSAEVVGTAFKTLFARLQDLELGETLDDGTTLGKYSQALDAVGIDIKDTNGELKDMDVILSELGNKWTTLSKDTQVALAQTVAGTRQYTQLVALMDNWDYFQKNLGVIDTSEGTLEQQAQIYAESWEAASKRVSAAAQGIYESLINDDFFISLLDSIEKILTFIDNLIDGLGGLKGVLLTVSTLLMKTFSTQMAAGITNMAHNLRMLTQSGRQGVQNARTQTLNNMVGMMPASDEYTGTAEEARIISMRKTIELQSTMTENANKMNDFELATNRTLMDRNKILAQQYIDSAQQKEQAQNRNAALISGAQTTIAQRFTSYNDSRPEGEKLDDAGVRKAVAQKYTTFGNRQQDIKGYAQLQTIMQKLTTATDLSADKLEELKKAAGSLKSADVKGLGDWIKSLKAADIAGDQLDGTYEELQSTMGMVLSRIKESMQASMGQAGGLEMTDKEVDDLIASELRLVQVEDQVNANRDEFIADSERLNNSLRTSQGLQATWATGLVSTMGAIASVASAIQSITGLIDVWNNQDMTGGEKILTTISTLAMVLPMVITSFSMLNLQQMAGLSGAIAMAFGFTGEAQAAVAAGTATAGFGATLYTVLWPIGLLMLAIGALIGIVYLLIKAFEQGPTAVEKAQVALEETTKTAQALSEKLDKARESAEKVKQVFEEYENLSDNLSKLAEGTDEWRTALQEVQMKMKEIMDLYPELADAYLESTGEKAFYFDPITGLYTMGSWVEQYATEMATLEVMNAEIANTIGQIGVARAKLSLQKAKLDAQLTKDIYATNYVTTGATTYDESAGVTRGTVTFAGNTYKTEKDSSGFTYIRDENAGVFGDVEVSYLHSYYDILKEVADLATSDGQMTSVDQWNEYLNSPGTQAYINERVAAMGLATYGVTQEMMEEINKGFSDQLEIQLGIYDEYDLAMAKHVEYIEQQNTQLAQSLLSTQRAFGLLEADERSAATILTEQTITNLSEAWDQAWVNDGGLTGSGNTWGRVWGDSEDAINFRKMLAGVVGRTPTHGDWQGQKDIGWNFENSDLGKAIVDKYLEINGITGDGVEFRAYDMRIEGSTLDGSLGDDHWVSYDEMLAAIMAQYLNEEVDEAAIIQHVQDVSNGEFGKAIIAGITGNFNSLTPEEVEAVSYTNADGVREFTTDYLGRLAQATGLTMTELQNSDMYKQSELALQNYNAELAKTQALQRDVAAGNNILAQAAAELDLDEETLQNYAKTLQAVNAEQEISYEQAAQLAVANARMSKGLERLREDFEDNLKILKSLDRQSYEVIEAATETANALSDIFGVDVSSDFVLDHLNEIEKAVAGDVEEFKKLELLAAQDYVAHLAIDDTYKGQLSAILMELDSLPDVGIGIQADLDPAYVDQLNQMLKDGVITAEQLTAAFGTVGWSPNIKYRKEAGPETTTNLSGDIIANGEKVATISGSMVSTTEVNVPYIDDSEGTGSGSNVISSLGQKSYVSNITSKNSSSGGGSKKDPKTADEEKERYYEINQALDTMSKKLDRIAAAKERAFGKAKLALIEQELEVIEDEVAAAQDLLDAIEENAKNDKANLQAFGFTFDEENNISNYDAIMDQEIAAYNAALASGSEKKIEAAEKRWELFQKYLTQYEETMDAWDDALLAQMEKKNKQYEKLFEQVTYEIEIKLDLQEDEIKRLDHLFERIDDDAFAAADAIGLLGQKTQAALNQAATYAEGITGILDLHGLDADTINGVLEGKISVNDIKDQYGFSDDDIAKLREYSDGLMDVNNDLLSFRETIQEKVLETFEAWNEEIDKGVSKIEHLSAVLDAYSNIVDLVGKSTLGIDDDFIVNLSKAKTENAQNAFKAQNDKYNASVAARNRAEAEYLKALESDDEETINSWKTTLEELDAAVNETHESMLSSWQSALEAAQEQFAKTVEETVSIYESALSGLFKNLEDLQSAFEQQSEISERYIQDYTKIYELSKLTRNVTNSIDETDSVKAKKVLRDLQKEIVALQESDAQMSEYDLEFLQKKYELKLAEIALEEAQNAKSQVRMRKDAEGNYSYIFTANQQAIDQAAQSYEDKLHDMQELNTNYILEMQNNILQSEIELANAIRALDRTKYKSDEEYYAEVNRLQTYYAGQRNYYLEELNNGLNNNQQLYSQDWYNYSQYSNYKISADGEFIDSFDETVYAQLTGYTSIANAQDVYAEATKTMVSNLVTAFREWQTNVASTMEEAGTSVENFAGDVTEAVGTVTQKSQEAAQEVETAADNFTTSFGIVCDEVLTWQDTYSLAILDAIESNDDMVESCVGLIGKLSEVDGGLETTAMQFITTAEQIEAAAQRIQAAATAAANAASGVNGGTTTTTTTTTNPKSTARTFKVTATSGVIGWKASAFPALEADKTKVSDSNFQLMHGKKLNWGATFGESVPALPITALGQKWYYYNGYYYPESALTTLATGGYTGEWGPEGRLAMLHQKELILNAEDTQNMLSAVNIIRDISRVIDLNAASAANALGLLSTAQVCNDTVTIEQEVTIHAEFPGATDRYEIEEAFNTLINQAAQFANRKNM